ncbi:hypothetical protein [Dictyobacter formicarum]|uniref:3-keto-disaccharide hydrolase domain-containing protein n=1 Tax=Dictyobacter formicarum TaxID=2778368 RepID=A0ABQ3VPJ6_9CHLR|nr:hypothetical protein [Dictyobacter formicarum]GHO87772.1 hypothetical protein KSZ_57780 [Dictyobacter formicarum]
MQNCPDCGNMLSPGMTRCPYCRCNLPTAVAEDTYHTYYAGSRGATSGYTAHGETYNTSASSRGHSYMVSVATAPTIQTHEVQQHKIVIGIMLGAIMLLSLLLIVSGVSLLYYTKVTHPVQLHTQATATAYANHIINIHNKATAQAQTTRTAIRQKKATSIASTQATAQAQATATILKNLYAKSTSGRPAIAAPLLFETGQKWDVYPTRDGGGCAFTPDGLHSSVFKTDSYAPCFAHATRFHNFALEIRMAIKEGDEGGVIFRSTNHDKSFYSFRLNRSGVYGLILTRSDGYAIPLIYDKSPFIKTGTGQTNTLTIIAQGNNIYLYINKRYVGSASDSSYKVGTIGIMAVNRAHDTVVSFNNLHIWRL